MTTQPVLSLVSAAPVAEAPKRASPQERRTILDALTDSYDETRHRYRGAGSDKVLSENLNMPRAWIAEIREFFNFGPDESERSLAQSEADKAFVTKALELENTCMELASKFEQLRREFERRVLS